MRWPWRRRRDDECDQVDDMQGQIEAIEQAVASLSDHVVMMHARMRLVQQELGRASEDAAHIEYLSHQYAFVSILPSIAGVLVAVGVLTLADLDPVPFVMVIFAGILSVLSPVLMLVIGRQYRAEAPERAELVRQRARRHSTEDATEASSSGPSQSEDMSNER